MSTNNQSKSKEPRNQTFDNSDINNSMIGDLKKNQKKISKIQIRCSTAQGSIRAGVAKRSKRRNILAQE